MLLPLLLTACFGPGPGEPGATLLARHPEQLVELELSQATAPVLAHQGVFPAPFALIRSADGLEEYGVDLPLRLVPFATLNTRKPPGMHIWDDQGTQLEFLEREREEPIASLGTWTHSKGRVFVSRAAGSGPPTGYSFHHPDGWAEQLSMDGPVEDPQAFALRSMPLWQARREGVYLPAPSHATWQVTVPQSGRFETWAWLMSPAVKQGERSGGATLVVEVNGDRVERERLKVDGRQHIQVNLRRYGGQTVELTLRTEPGESPKRDYIFLEEPSLYTPSEAPRRVVVVMVDTLRRDHLSLYGHDRPTSPNLDALAEQALVFDNARAFAPWTLPSTRAALSGRHPDRWTEGPHLGQVLARHGLLTAAVTSNMYITDKFGLARGWGVYYGRARMTATGQASRAIELVESYPEQDLAVFLHFMDPHLPYREPPAHRIWEGESPVEWPAGPTQSDYANGYKAAKGAKARAAIADHVSARYDQNIHYVDEQLQRVLDAYGPDTTVLFFSDHGEALFDKGKLAHGFNLSEPMLQVPLVLKGPGVSPGRSSAPATHQDILPTLLDVLGLPPEPGVHGQSLLEPVSPDRPIAAGHPWVGDEVWSVLVGTRKWLARGADEAVYNLELDTMERRNLADDLDLQPYRDALSEALHAPVLRVLRLRAPRHEFFLKHSLVRLTVPSGIEEVWSLPGENWPHRVPSANGSEIVLDDRQGPAEVYVLPAGETAGSELSMTLNGRELKAEFDGETPVRVVWGADKASAGWVWRPRSPNMSQPLDETVMEELRRLGYVE